ncbi:hypothetical protein [Magnetospirillum fulvum]|uniref:hypothetical protein n=1 Tax=Magnetospirillum fulvum TaxID=1082 RepID=UPI0011152698|nr:hypothetical protein [Magnetospirillum fulvum]
MRKIALFATLAIVLSACGTSPVKLSSATATPPERVLSHATPEQGFSPVIIVRDSGFFGSGVYQSIHVDGVLSVKLATGEMAKLYLAPGDHVLGVIPSPNLFGSHTIYEIGIRIEPNRTHYLRVSIGPEGSSRLAPTAEVQ